jgi:N-acyl-D-amino-acid deacylase
MRQPDVRERLLSEEPDGLLRAEFRIAEEMFAFGDPPEYSPAQSETLGARAARMGIGALELAYDILLEREGRAMLYLPTMNFAHYNLDSTREMMLHPDTIIGLGDGGAHVARICDASLPTHMLTYWTRDRAGERLPLETAVKMLSDEPARTVGLGDRGRIATGYLGDLNVIDYDGLQLRAPRIVRDLPAGGARLNQGADGFVATVKRGVITYRNGEPTDALPGRLVRGAQAAPARCS